MKVLIVSTNRYKRPLPVMPIGACIVAEAAEQAGHDVSLIDLMFSDDPLGDLRNGLKAVRPDVVGFSIRNIDNNDLEKPVSFVGEAAELVDAVRRRSDADIVIGGGAVGIMPEALLAATKAHWAVLGDGETVFPRLLAALSDGDVSSVPGIAWGNNGTFRKNAGHTARLLDRCIVPDYTRWVDVRRYSSHMCTAPIQTKRGCPFKCVYCTYGIAEGTEYRLSPPEAVAGQVERLAEKGLPNIEFVDNVFNSPYEHAMAICEAVARARTSARLETVELAPQFVDTALLNAMSWAGFVGIGISAESASDEVLSRLGKGFTAADLHRTAAAVNRSGLPCLWMFMLGGPGERIETVRETIAFAKENVGEGSVAFFNVGVRVYPGTEIERIGREEGVITADARAMVEPTHYFSPLVERSAVEGELAKAMEERLNFIGPYSINHPYITAVERVGHAFGMRPPIWRHTRIARRALRLIGKDTDGLHAGQVVRS